MRPTIIGTRGSALALWQARWVAGQLRQHHPELEIVERIIKTEGDIQQQTPLSVGDRGVFVAALEQALARGEIDLAVHSLKDLPTVQPDTLTIAAVPVREDARDVLLSREGWNLDSLPKGTHVATASLRRRCQLLSRRPDLEVMPVRGNVDTRMRKLQQGEYDALVLALAGVRRLGIESSPMVPLEPEDCLPAVGQGALAIETRRDDAETIALCAVLEDRETRDRVRAERAFLKRLGGGCLAPAAGYAVIANDRLQLRAVVGDPDGIEVMRESVDGLPRDSESIGVELADRMLAAGAGRLLAVSRE